jgi:hypothetical protein
MQPSSPEEGRKGMEAWLAYFGKLGDKIVDLGAPFGRRKSMSGGAPTAINGYTVITAASFA